MVNIMDLSNIFSMLLENKTSTQNSKTTQNFNQKNFQNIYPNCTILEQQNKTENNNINNNIPSDNLISSLLPLIMSGQKLSMQDILKKTNINNPMLSTILKQIDNKQSQKKHISKIDISGLEKVNQE